MEWFEADPKGTELARIEVKKSCLELMCKNMDGAS